MSPRGIRPLLAVTALLAALVFSVTGQAEASCASAVLNDWRDGHINGTHSVACYQTALAQLREDLRIYSTAESDIKQALLSRTKVALAAPAKAERQARSDGGNGSVSPLLVLAIVGAILAVTGSAFALAR